MEKNIGDLEICRKSYKNHFFNYSLNKKDDEARLIIQLKTKRCTTSKNVFGDLEPLTEESFVSEDDPSTNKITISSIEDIPTIGCSSSNPDQTSLQQPPPSRQQYNKKGLLTKLKLI